MPWTIIATFTAGTRIFVATGALNPRLSVLLSNTQNCKLGSGSKRAYLNFFETYSKANALLFRTNWCFILKSIEALVLFACFQSGRLPQVGDCASLLEGRAIVDVCSSVPLLSASGTRSARVSARKIFQLEPSLSWR